MQVDNPVLQTRYELLPPPFPPTGSVSFPSFGTVLILAPSRKMSIVEADKPVQVRSARFSPFTL